MVSPIDILFPVASNHYSHLFDKSFFFIVSQIINNLNEGGSFIYSYYHYHYHYNRITFKRH